MSARPPASISYTAATKGLAGMRNRPDMNEPVAHAHAAPSTKTMPKTLPVVDPPRVRDSSERPPKPMATPVIVVQCGRSPARRRNTTSHSGTDAMSRAVRPDEMCCSAMLTPPLPNVSSRIPTSTAEPSACRRSRRTDGPYRIASTAPSTIPAAMKRMAPPSSGGIVSMTMRIPR